MLLQELAQLNVARLTVEERWTLMRSAEKASEYVVIRRDAINSPKDARVLAFARLQGLEREVFLVILLNTQNQVLYCEPMFLGTIDSCAVHPREVVTKAMEVNAAAAIFAHNHPDGSTDLGGGYCHYQAIGGGPEVAGCPGVGSFDRWGRARR